MGMFETLGKVMGPTDRLRAACLVCGRTATWTREEAVAAFGEFAPPWQVRQRVRCADCGERDQVTVTI